MEWALLAVLLQVTIERSIQDLGHENYFRREAAQKTLEQTMPWSESCVEKATKDLDLERSRRAERVLSNYYSQRADLICKRVFPTTYPYVPWIDQLPNDSPHWSNLYLNWAERLDHKEWNISKSGKPLGRWSEYRVATRLLIGELLRQRISVEEIVKLLDRMVVIEQEYVRRHRYSPMISKHVKELAHDKVEKIAAPR